MVSLLVFFNLFVAIGYLRLPKVYDIEIHRNLTEIGQKSRTTNTMGSSKIEDIIFLYELLRLLLISVFLSLKEALHNT